VKKYALSVVLLLALPAVSQIVDVQNASNFLCSGSTCQVILSTQPHTTQHNLIAVWTYWQSSGAYTASVSDSPGNTFYSAVGPTLQSASSPPINAQIFYARNINPSAVHDTVTVTFNGVSGTISAGGVAVEYSGLDLVNPLDSVSAASSQSTGLLLDSGFAALSSTTVVAFGGGLTDSNYTPTVGNNFVSVQSTLGTTSPGALTEEYIPSNNPTTPPSTLPVQAATAGTPGSLSAGNWIMQMAAFRAATSTVYAGWSPVRPPQAINAAQYPGIDPCAQLVAAEAANGSADIVLPIVGGGESSQTPCSVDPLSGFSSSGRVTVTSVGNGNSVVLAVNSPIHISSSQTLEAPAGRATDSSVVMIAASPTFQSLAGNRLWTNSGMTPPFSVSQEGGTGGSAAGCLRIIYATLAVNPLYVIRGTEPDVQLSGFANPAMNGNFRVVAGNGGGSMGGWGDPFCVTTATHANGPTNTSMSPYYVSFVIFNPAAAGYTCAGSTCNLYNGSTLVSTAQVQGMTYLICNGPCPSDSVGTGSCASSDSSCAITLQGGIGSGTKITQGAILKNIGVLANAAAGVAGMFCAYCQEGSGWVNDSTAVARVPGPVGAKFSAAASGGLGSSGNTSQNMYTFQGFEDYCNNNIQNCFTASEGATYSFSNLSVNTSGTYSGIPMGLPVNAFAGYQFTTSGFMNSRNNQTCHSRVLYVHGHVHGHAARYREYGRLLNFHAE